MDEVEAIRRLKARYFRLLDTKDWGDLVEVFSEDVAADMTGVGGPAVQGATELVGFLRESLTDVVTVHYGHMPEIDITSPTTATGIWSLEDYLWWPEGGPWRSMHGFGHYHETYEKTDAGWQIKTWAITRLHVVTEPWPAAQS